RSPIVVGYSGWEGDVFMSALQKRLKRTLPYNVYWFCYSEGATKLLPNWLTEHPNVNFVIPQTALNPGPESYTRITREAAGVEDDSIIRTNIKPTIGKDVLELGAAQKIGNPLLPAKDVFDGLVRTFRLRSPELTRDPLGFILQQLESSLPTDI